VTSVGAQYTGRFAPSPTGPLHAGSLVAGLASWLDARAHGGRWLVRIEDVDTPRCVPGTDHLILNQLQQCGLVPDDAPVWQSARSALYQQALAQLLADKLVYPCRCSRKDIAAALQTQGRAKPRHGELVYPGTCRHHDTVSPNATEAAAWRLRVGFDDRNRPPAPISIGSLATENIANSITHWQDRRLGAQQQDVAAEVGDFVLKRADGCFTYQLAVVVDDAAQGITHVVRGEDLADNTARQSVLQQALRLPTPHYLHTPLVRGANGEKLSKQNGARALDLSNPLAALNQAAACLGLPAQIGGVPTALATWMQHATRLRLDALASTPS
jgi:glutamyl-Q tRNA(Asp) synthetase